MKLKNTKLKKKENIWFVYIIKCDDRSFYTGIAKDIDKRFEEHKKGRGAAYTKMHKPQKVIYREKMDSQTEAIKRELQIKSWGRDRKIKELSLKI